MTGRKSCRSTEIEDFNKPKDTLVQARNILVFKEYISQTLETSLK